jgi:hypothetical protein
MSNIFIESNCVELAGNTFERLFNHPQGQKWRVIQGEDDYDYVGSKDLISKLELKGGFTDITISYKGKSYSLTMRKRKDKSGQSHYDSYQFYYPDGNIMGGLDREGGGALGHPNFDVQCFIEELDSGRGELYELDPQAYCDLEDILLHCIDNVDPMYLTPEAKEAHFADKPLKAMKCLLAALTDPKSRTEVEAEIEKRKAELGIK